MGMGFQCEQHRLGLWDFELGFEKNNFLGNGIRNWKVLEKGHWSWKVLEICILVPRAYDPSGLRQESRALGATISGMCHR